ncbi:MAG: hypothetical protein RLY61_763, partial [Candidatus Parcubacteria bacterium]
MWGVLALNTDKSIYTLGESVKFAFAVLDPKGDMVCDAKLTLTIEHETTKEQDILTTDQGIKVNEVCKLHAYTLIPDYEATYKPLSNGNYSLKLKAVVNKEIYEIQDTFKVEQLPNFDIQRETVTRVYPIEEYPVVITIKANKAFKGIVKETVPSSFDISELSDVKAFDEYITGDEESYLLWNVDLKPKETLKVGYTFDAPNKSPDFFTLGKLKLIRTGSFLNMSVDEYVKQLNTSSLSNEASSSSIDSTETITTQEEASNIVLKKEVIDFEELRFWQLANDAVGHAYPTRKYTTGFELNSTTAGMEYDANINTPAISNSIYRSGSYSLNTALVSSGTEGINHAFDSVDTGTQHYIRAYLRVATAPSAEIKVIEMYTTGAASRGYIKMTTGRTLKLYDGSNTLIGSASSPLDLNTWYRVEIMIDSAGAGSAQLTLKLDGANVSSTTTGTLASYNNFSIGILETATADFYWDDIAVNEEDAVNEDNWPGDGKVVYLRPNANGSDTGWTNTYTAVDEVTPNDATDYISCSSGTDKEDYEYQGSSDVGIASTDNIKLVEGWIRTSSDAGTARSHTLAIEYSGNQDLPPAATTVASTTWYTEDDTMPRESTVISYNQPGSDFIEPITPTMLDSFSTELTTSDCSPTIRVTAIWLVVEYFSVEGGRVFSSGFELQSTTAGVEWTSVSGSPAISTSTVNGGAASLRIASLSSGTQESLTYAFEATSTNTNGPLYFRTYLYITTAPSAENRIISLKNSAGTTIAYLTLDNSRILKIYDEDSVVGSGSSALSTSTWYRLEFKFDATGSGSTDVIEARLNGGVFATSSVRNLSSGIRTLSLGANINSEANTTGDLYYDDVAVNKNLGNFQNSYPGVGKIAHLRPDGAGSIGSWTGGYADVDEITPDDASTRLSTSTVDAIERVTLDDTSVPGIASGAHINLVSLGVRYQKTVTTGALAVSLLDSTGYFVESESINSSTSYDTNSDVEPKTYPLTMYTRPQLNTLWTTSELDSAEYSVRYIDNTGSPSIFVSTAWVLVEYYDPIDVTGSCDAFDQTTDCGDTGTVRVAINGELVYAKQDTIAGSWTVDDIPKPSSSDIVTVFIDGASDTDEAVAVTQYDGSGDITGIKLFKEHLSLGSADDQNLSNTDL